MAQVCLTKAAGQLVRELGKLELYHDTAIIITAETRTDVLLGRFIDRETLKLLKTKVRGRVFPGIEVHLFGVESLAEDTILELDFLPISNRGQLISDFEKKPPQENWDFCFRVNIRKARDTRKALLKTAAS
jgi:hypothetical protein